MRCGGCSGGAATFSARSPRRPGSTSPAITADTTMPNTSSGRRAPSSASRKMPPACFLPRLYREFLQPVDREVAGHFPNAFIHLHTNSMFLYDLYLEVEEIRCFQVNYELRSGGPPIAGMVPAFRKIQAAGRPLLVRGSFTANELRHLVDSLDPRGLYLYIMVGSLAEVEALRPVLGM